MADASNERDPISDQEIEERARQIFEFLGRPKGREAEARQLAEAALRRQRSQRQPSATDPDPTPESLDESEAGASPDDDMSSASFASTKDWRLGMKLRPTEDRNQRFKRIAWPYLPDLLRTARFLTRRQHTAEDLVQDAMLKALRFIDTFQEGTNAKAWLMTILRRTHIDNMRSGRYHPDELPIEEELHLAAPEAPSPSELDERWANPEELLEQFDDATMIAAIKSLPHDLRWTLLLVDVEQIDHQQAARVLGVPVGTIKSRAHRARRLLRDRLTVMAAGTVPDGNERPAGGADATDPAYAGVAV
jgi:RNA polymerase sigma-70 factor, ECF subfamily